MARSQNWRSDGAIDELNRPGGRGCRFLVVSLSGCSIQQPRCCLGKCRWAAKSLLSLSIDCLSSPSERVGSSLASSSLFSTLIRHARVTSGDSVAFAGARLPNLLVGSLFELSALFLPTERRPKICRLQAKTQRKTK